MNIIRQKMLESLGLGQHGVPEQPLELDEAITDAGQLRAVFMCGSAGSGKSYVIKQLMDNVNPKPKIVDSDKLFVKKLQVANLPSVIPPEDAPSGAEKELRKQQLELRNKAMESIKQVINNYLNGYLPILIDGTGKSYNNMVARKQTLEKLGYDTMCIVVSTSLDVAQERNAKRDRKLPAHGAGSVDEIWKLVQDNIPKYKQLFGENCIVVDNNPGMLNVGYMSEHVNKFFEGLPKNPIGQELVKSQAANRKVDPADVAQF